MSEGIYVALSGAIAQTTLLEATANNLANASTDGYRRTQPVFRAVLSRAGAAGPVRFTALDGAAVDSSAGALRATGRGLDAALPDGVFLAVSTPRGERYTRAVSLAVGADGTVRTASGDAVVGEDGRALVVPRGAGEVGITPEGELRQGATSVGRLRLVRFQRPDALAPEGGTLLAARGGAGPAPASGATLEVGSVESSNASVVGAMTELVTATRTFEAFQRVIDAFREADRRVVTSVPGAGP